MTALLLPSRPLCLQRRLFSLKRHTATPFHSKPIYSYVRLFSHKTVLLAQQQNSDQRTTGKPKPTLRELRENIYTLPNALTVSRILACPILGWSILEGNFQLATFLLTYAGLSDWVDGYLARRWNQGSVIGSIIDPAADKILMTTLTVTLTMKSLLPLPLAVIILGRDVLLGLSAFYIRYRSLPSPKTFSRYWDFSIPSAEVRPTFISKINTALQLLLMGVTTINPLLTVDLNLVLQALQWTVGGTTIWSGLSYVFTRDAVRLVNQQRSKP